MASLADFPLPSCSSSNTASSHHHHHHERQQHNDAAVVIGEVGGRLTIASSRQDARLIQNDHPLLAGYPTLDRTQLAGLQHSLSREDVRSLFLTSPSSSSSFLHVSASSSTDSWSRFYWTLWYREGSWSLLRYLLHDTVWANRVWLFTDKLRLNLGIDRSITTTEDRISAASKTLSWKSNWLRAVVFHPTGSRMAVCQRNDYIRVYEVETSTGTTTTTDSFTADQDKRRPLRSSPITLRHQLQKNVTDMAFRPFEHFALAVACDTCVLIWRVDADAVSNRPTPHCAQALSAGGGSSHVCSVVWSATGNVLFASSVSSSCISIWSPLSGTSDSLSCWSGGAILRMQLSPSDGRLLAVHHSSNLLRIYDTQCWRSWSWSHLPGACRASVWSPSGDQLLFVCDRSTKLFLIRLFDGGTGGPASPTPSYSSSSSWLGGMSSASDRAVEVFDFSEVYDISADGNESTAAGSARKIGGPVHDLALSPDGYRLVVSFSDHPETLALFAVDWKMSLILCPCDFICGSGGSYAEIISFAPGFSPGSLLVVVWSNGRVQYVPLLTTGGNENKRSENFANESQVINGALNTSAVMRKSLLSPSDNLFSK